MAGSENLKTYQEDLKGALYEDLERESEDAQEMLRLGAACTVAGIASLAEMFRSSLTDYELERAAPLLFISFLTMISAQTLDYSGREKKKALIEEGERRKLHIKIGYLKREIIQEKNDIQRS